MEPWKCGHTGCSKVIDEQDAALRRVAVASHEKTHKNLPDGPRKGGKGGSSESWIGGVVDGIGDAIGDVVGSIFD